jgi:hypothetical protein
MAEEKILASELGELFAKAASAEIEKERDPDWKSFLRQHEQEASLLEEEIGQVLSAR